MIRNLTIIILGLVLLTSCFSKADKADILILNNISLQLDSARIVLDAIDFTEVEDVQRTISNDVEFVKKHDQYFMKNENFVKYYGLYSGAGRTISRVLKANFINYPAKLEYSQHQVKSLKKDLKRGVIPNDSISIYMNQESAASLELVQTIVRANETLLLQLETYASVKDSMMQQIVEVKKQIALE